MTGRHIVAERWLREQLIALRTTCGLRQDVAAEKAGMSPRTLSRLEWGPSRITAPYLATLCDTYEVPREMRNELRRLLDKAAKVGWWNAYAGLIPRVYAEHCELEQEALRIDVVAIHVIPGFVQIEPYARFAQAVSVANNMGDQAEGFVRFRLERQERAFARPRSIRILLHEAAIRHNAGLGVMAGQIDHLLDLETRGQVKVRVLPFDVEHLITASFVLFAMDGRRAACLDGFTVEEHVETPDSLDTLECAFETAWDKSTPLNEMNGR